MARLPQGYPQAGGHMQQPGGYAQQPGGYAAQPPPQGHPGYTPGHNVPYNSVQAAHSYDSCCACFNIQWCGRLLCAGSACFAEPVVRRWGGGVKVCALSAVHQSNTSPSPSVPAAFQKGS